MTVASNELVNGLGDGDSTPDWEVIDDHHLRLRAERAGKGTGRIYTITTTCTDESNHTVTKTSSVLVPKSMKGGSWTMVAVPRKDATAEILSGAAAADPLVTGMINFDFEGRSAAKSRRNENLLNLLLGKVNFRALGYESKSVSGAKTQFIGLGTVNNMPGYRYILTVTDGQAAGGDGVDRFRLRIWNEKTGDTVFDNQVGAADDAEPTTAIGDGNSIKLP